ncbi:MAG: GNAT family N-acetyltransferase [Chloroflexota bacterium]
MNYLSYSAETAVYPLAPNITLERAGENDFLNYWVAYRGVNEDYSQNFAEQVTDLRGAPCFFWLKKGQQRLAGLLMMPNNIGDLFLIPPFADLNKGLQWLMPQLRAWSNPERNIIAQAILPQHLDAFLHAGFQLAESRRWMIRPTAILPFAQDNAFRWIMPTATDQDMIAELFLAAFWGTIGERGQRTIKAHRRSVANYFAMDFPSSLFSEASTLLYEKETGKPTAVCLVGLYKSHPSINFVATHPDYQGRGLGTALINRAITLLQPHYPSVILRVTVGNLAEKLYEWLGFAPATAVSTLLLPPM